MTQAGMIAGDTNKGGQATKRVPKVITVAWFDNNFLRHARHYLNNECMEPNICIIVKDFTNISLNFETTENML